ncbi:hypothetical protein B4U79_18876, partial [Dinothrombium tinctorium]
SFEDLNCIKKVLEKISQSNLNFNNVIICGDFNLDMLNEKDTRKQDLENLMSLSCLSQIVSKPTFPSSSPQKLIDLVFVQNQILNCNVVPNISNSCDHLAIVFEIDLSYEFKSKRIITKYKSDVISLINFKRRIIQLEETFNFENFDDIDKLYETLLEKIGEIMKDLKTIVKTSEKFKMTKEMRKLLYKKRKSFKNFQCTRKTKFFDEYAQIGFKIKEKILENHKKD